MATDITKLITTSRAARILDMSENNVRLLTNSGELPCIRTAGGRLFDPDEVEAFKESRAAT